jgi:hypothetical protein
MLKGLNKSLKSVVSTICHHSNLRNVIFVGSFVDYIHYNKYGYEPIKPKDLDIFCTSLQDLGGLVDKVQLIGPSKQGLYNGILPHTQYYFELLGVKVDVYVVEDLESLSLIDTEYFDYYGFKILINTEKHSISQHEKCVEFFSKEGKYEDLYRVRKHSRRLSFFKMLQNNIL